MTTLPNIKKLIEGAKAIKRAPIVNSKSAKRITGLRPILSERVPENRDPTAAPISAHVTIHPLYPSVISGHVSLK